MRHLRFFLMRMEIEIAGVEQRLRQIFAQLACRLRIVDVADKLAAPDTVIGKVLHYHHRQSGIEMKNVYRMLRAVLIVGDQGLCFEARAVEGQWPGFADAAHVGQRLLNNNPAHALSIENFEHQIEIAVAYLLRRHQLRRIVEPAKLLCVNHRIAGREGMVLRHCLDPQKC